MWEDVDVIHSYTRQNAIDDGVLVDVSDMAQEAGFRFPVAVTSGVWFQVIESDEESKAIGQSASGRLWDVLMVLRHTIKAMIGNGSLLYFEVLVVKDGKDKPNRILLKSLCGPSDDGSPCLTILLPDED